MRTEADLRRHYEIERELADRLRETPREERGVAYRAVYDELFRRVPDHPQLNADPAEQRAWVDSQLRIVREVVEPSDTFLEIGTGDAALASAVAGHVAEVVAVDVSEEIVARSKVPENVRLVLSDGRTVPVPPGSVDVAYSNQLMEHLHPADAREQLEHIVAALRPSGRYVCVTPHRYTGPHDISQFFDDEATGFHLHEYTTGELTRLLRAAGFSRVQSFFTLRGRTYTIPSALPRALELLLAPLPRRVRRAVGRTPLQKLLGVAVVATR